MTLEVGFATLLPDSVEVVYVSSDIAEAVLLPEEHAAIAGAVPRRRAEFTTVRHCARQALRRLGHPPVPILPGSAREPIWPNGVIGSLTHCEGYRAAAVAHANRIASLGIDVETHAPLPDGIAGLVTVGDEPRMLATLAATYPDIAWDRVLFSAKESIYKTWYPLAHRWLDFTECELDIDPDTAIFTGRLLVPGPTIDDREITQFTGRWTIHRQHIFTAVWEPADQAGHV